MFLGTSEFAVPALQAVAHACEVAAVVTRPDRPRGRGRRVGASPVAEAAASLGLETLKPEKPNAPEWRERIAAFAPELFAVVAYGAILSPELLAVPKLGCMNLHGSLLPDYRGASPVQRALWDGRPATGVTTLWMDEGIDTGDVIHQRWCAIEPGDDAGTLGGRLADLGAPLLAASLQLAARGEAPRHPQDRAAGSYARKLAKGDGAVDWTLDAQTIWNRQRAVTPWPGATAVFQGKRLLLVRTVPRDLVRSGRRPGELLAVGADGLAVACGSGVLLVHIVRPEGRGELDAAAWARGTRVEAGALLEPGPEAA